MRNIIFILPILILMMFTVTSCELIGDIFSAGFYAGIFVVIGVIVLLLWLFGRGRR